MRMYTMKGAMFVCFIYIYVNSIYICMNVGMLYSRWEGDYSDSVSDGAYFIIMILIE